MAPEDEVDKSQWSSENYTVFYLNKILGIVTTESATLSSLLTKVNHMADAIDTLKADVEKLIAWVQGEPARTQATVTAAVAGDMSRAQATDAEVTTFLGTLNTPVTPSVKK